MQQHATWLRALAKPSKDPAVIEPLEGLIAVRGEAWRAGDPAQVTVLEKAAQYGADYVFFRATAATQTAVAEALVFVDDGLDDDAFAEKHRRLWSWGGVPLVYRKTRGRVDLLRCAHTPDFIGKDGRTRYHAFDRLDLLTTIDAAVPAPWWDATLLRSGALWDEPKVCGSLLSAGRSSARTLVKAIADLDTDLDNRRVLPERLRRRLLVLALLIAYLEDRGVLGPTLFGRCKRGAARFFEVLADGEGLVRLLVELEQRFNGDVFHMTPDEQAKLKETKQLGRFAELVEGRTDPTGQTTLWRLYSFRDLPVELISHVYQHFVRTDRSAIYTPPFLVRLMLEEALGWARLDRLEAEGMAVLDPSCGSGVFLVEAYKRMIVHWRYRHGWARPDVATLRLLLLRVRGVDVNADAVELAAFSLCLAMCESLDTEALQDTTELFPKLRQRSLHTGCFFEAKASGVLGHDVGVVVGNPPFESKLATQGARDSYARYLAAHGKIPDKQVAFLFVHECLGLLRVGGVLCMLQNNGMLYTFGAQDFRRQLFEAWDVREVLDFSSVRGMFGAADPRVVAVVVEAQPPSGRQILHATFRRSGRVVAEQGCDLDYYDMHWLPHAQVLADDSVWRGNLVGGGRVNDLVARLRDMRTVGGFATQRRWDMGQGFIRGGSRGGRLCAYLHGKTLLPSEALTANGLDESQLDTVPDGPIEEPRSEKRFTAPMLLVRLHADLQHHLEPRRDFAYADQVLGVCAPKAALPDLRRLKKWLHDERRPLQAYVAATSRKLQRAPAIMKADIEALPYPASGSLDLSPNERIVVDDIVDYYRDFVRLGEKSKMMKIAEADTLRGFCDTYIRQVGTIYRGLRALDSQRWPGAICQPFVFGESKVEVDDVGALERRVVQLLASRDGEALQVQRIARVFDGPFILLLKPDRTRYWLRSVALRDADETLSELHAQGL